MTSILQTNPFEQLIVLKVQHIWEASGQFCQEQWDSFLNFTGKNPLFEKNK
jgi:hypothetical protein